MRRTFTPKLLLFITLFFMVSCVPPHQGKLTKTDPPSVAVGALNPDPSQSPGQKAVSDPGGSFPTILKTLWVRANITSPQRCALPCWWDMMPGESRWDEQERIFNRAGFSPILSGYDPQTGYAEYVVDALAFNDDLPWGYMNVIVDQEEVIRSIEFMAGQYPRTEQFMEWYSEYTPEVILGVYGEPDEIYLSVFYKDNDPGALYLISFSYYAQHFSVLYMGATPIGSILELCPTFEPGGNLDSTVLILNLGEALGIQRMFGDVEQKVLSLERATRKEVSDFYEAFLNTGQIDCLSTPLDIWVGVSP